MFERSVLIVAHPDDEVLWFGSILWKVDRIVVAFRDYDAKPELGRRRADALAELPYRNMTCLGIPEAGSWHLADWTKPLVTEFGLALSSSDGSSGAALRYETNFRTLHSRLHSELTPDTTVFTHNPWGEYGHEDHVQLFRVLDGLRSEIGFPMWMPTYCSAWSAVLAARYGPAPGSELRCFPVDRAAAERIVGIYKKHECWTWWNDGDWPAEEGFISMPLSEVAGRQGPGPIRLTNVALPP